MSGLVEGKVALVTGAANGIGRASALRFAAEGAKVAVADLDTDGAAETVEMVTAAGGEAVAFTCDIADEDSVEQLVSDVVARFGGLHCAHNNAGLGHGQSPLHEIDRAAWDRTFDVNVTGTWLCLKYELRHMMGAGGGSIVCTSSATSLSGMPLVAGYAASKAAINTLVKTAAVGYAEHGIRVNAILPGPIGTDMVARALKENPDLRQHLNESIPLKRVGTPEEVAEAVVWLCSDRTGFTTGALLSIDGGEVAR